jgi:hypothetical protein
LAPYRRLVLLFALDDGCVQAPVQKRTMCRVIPLIIAVCCRRISAVQKPRTAPAQALAALSQRLIQGLGMELPPMRKTIAAVRYSPLGIFLLDEFLHSQGQVTALQVT